MADGPTDLGTGVTLGHGDKPNQPRHMPAARASDVVYSLVGK